MVMNEGIAMSSGVLKTRPDTVVVYDVMREAANRLGGYYYHRADVVGTDVAVAEAVQRNRAVAARVRAVDSYDHDEILALTASFRAEYESCPED